MTDKYRRCSGEGTIVQRKVVDGYQPVIWVTIWIKVKLKEDISTVKLEQRWLKSYSRLRLRFPMAIINNPLRCFSLITSTPG